MPSIVAIVGRPNVGKSTLFNRLVGKKLALVDPTPGLTRDRRMADVNLSGCPVTLTDTAGLEEGEPGSLSHRMRQQTEIAIREAALVLFVVDARSGITPADEVFAEVVRVSGRPVLLVVNKCEGRAGESGYYEAYSLGLGEPTAISAEHNEGIATLEAEIAERLAAGDAPEPAEDTDGEAEPLTEEEALDPAKPIRVAVIGRPNVGKSTLVNALLGEERMLTGPEAGLTRDTIAVNLDTPQGMLRLYDTAGLRRKAKVEEGVERLAVTDTLRAIRFAEVVILVVDAMHPFEKQDLQIGELSANEGRAVVIAFNKWDLADDKQKRLKELREDMERLLPDLKDVSVVPLSAMSGRGLDKLLKAVFATYRTWNKRLPTAKLNRWLEGAIDRHTPPAVQGRRIKLRYMTQPNARPPTFIAFCSAPDALPKSYVRYLVNSLRETFDLPGVPIRLHLRKGANPYDR
ncbi:MAG: ribosome biogenesis GTPase Der [Hyphomicrobiaceae bacterium]